MNLTCIIEHSDLANLCMHNFNCWPNVSLELTVQIDVCMTWGWSLFGWLCRSKIFNGPKLHTNEKCGNVLSANGTSCLTPVVDISDRRCTPPHLAPLTRAYDASEKFITIGTQTSVAKGSLPVRKSKTTGTKVARPRIAASLAESDVAANSAGGATAADVVKSTGSKHTAVSQERLKEGIFIPCEFF